MNVMYKGKPLQGIQRQHYEDGVKIIEELAKSMNAGGWEYDPYGVNTSSSKFVRIGMLNGFMNQHRTIQQNIVREFVGMLQEWGKLPENAVSDLRNQDAYKFAQTLSQQHFPFI